VNAALRDRFTVPRSKAHRHERPTIPAKSSLTEAEHWLLTESIGPNSAEAIEIRASRILKKRIRKGAMDWLRSVASGDNMKASWARLILAEIEREGRAVTA